MKLTEFKKHLSTLDDRFVFQLSNGIHAPRHFHVTEIGKVTKRFIDCGGTVRQIEFVSFQLWEAEDHDHRLPPGKLMEIINLSEKTLGLDGDLEVEVEYRNTWRNEEHSTIGKYSLEFNGFHFRLINQHTDCLAKDKCGVEKKSNEGDPGAKSSPDECKPDSGCC